MRPDIPNRSEEHQNFVNWFRNSSPYIHKHRKRTFVISFEGEAVMNEDFAHHVQDFALLNSLGIRLVLVHGIRPQIDERLHNKNHQPRFHKHLRITDDEALKCVKEAAGLVRVEIEARLSMGLPNSPMSGAKIRVISGNFIIARPLGILDGIDYMHTGMVRNIDHEAIINELNQHHVVLISPIGYSPSGEVFNLSAEQVAKEVAISVQAEKLILLTEGELIHPDSQNKISQLTRDEVQSLLNQYPDLNSVFRRPLQAALDASFAGIERVHLIPRMINGGLLMELFSRDGIGTLVSTIPYENLRPATLNDIGGILELIVPLEHAGILVKRSRENLEMEIMDYWVIERDGMILACAALHGVANENSGIIACLAVHPSYRRAARGNRLLECLLEQAKLKKLAKVYALSTQTIQWFTERGFILVNPVDLPDSLKSRYNPQRNSKILLMPIH